ncbi:MAG: MATE family efflux transporter [Burkholderiaceae bacterium]|jgi:MATE family multidrug resistance protein|nr:MATE family efflux transporter [Burkholderiaceae bacterium]MDH5208676.1 MATE family efflux transporter [Burkholderiaceae bacterium]
MADSEAPRAPDASSGALLKLAWPLFIANLAVVGNGTIDAIMAGRLSAADLAAVAIGSSIYITVYIGFMGVLQALSPIAGHHFGAHRWRAIGDDVQQALWLSVLLTIAGLPWVLATDLWVRFARVDGEVGRVATLYLQAIAFGLPAALATRVFVALNAAVSRPKVTMAINLAALGLKIPLNVVFMQGAGPIPALGGAGAGAATAVLAWLMLALSFAVWRLDPFYARFRSGDIHGPRWASLRAQLKLGVPIGLSTMFEVTSFTFMAVLIARLGAAAVAGHQIVANLVAILFMLPLSLGIATSVLVAQSLGAGAPRVARRAALRGFRVAMAIAAAAALALWLLRDPIVRLYTVDPAVAAVALSLLGLAATFHLFDAAQGVAGFVLRGYKSTFWPMVIYGVALWGIGLGGGYWIGLHTTPLGPARGPLGFWEAATVALALAAITLCALAAAVSRRRSGRE